MRQFSFLYITIAAVMALGFGSCKKDDISYGPPVITRVSSTVDRTASITTGELNQWLLIWGNNLSNATEISINDLVIEPKDFYSSDTLVSVKIPRQIPASVNDKITLTTPGGTTSFNFKVVIPQLSISGFTFDYPAPGDTLEIMGSNFDLYNVVVNDSKVSFAGNVEAAVVAASENSLKVVVPAGAQPGPVTVTGASPTNAIISSGAWYNDNRNILLNMNAFGGWNGSSYIQNGPDPVPFSVPYFKINKSWDGGWAWAPFMSNNVQIPAELVADPSRLSAYVLKFEMNIPAGTAALPQPLNIVFQGNGFKDAMFNPSPTGTLPYNTAGKWKTFSVPMSLFEGYAFKETTIMELMLKHSDPFQSDFAITNFRIVPR